MTNKILPNGSEIIAIDYEKEIVLALSRKNEFVTWSYNDTLDTTSNGHYFANIIQARDDFCKRVIRGY
jgi:hypothetical protein